MYFSESGSNGMVDGESGCTSVNQDQNGRW